MQFGDEIFQERGSAVELQQPSERGEQRACQEKRGQGRRNAFRSEVARELRTEPEHHHRVDGIQPGEQRELKVSRVAEHGLHGEK